MDREVSVKINLLAGGDFQKAIDVAQARIEKISNATRNLSSPDYARLQQVENNLARDRANYEMRYEAMNRPYLVEQMVRQEYAAKQKYEIQREAQYSAKYGRLGGAMNVADRVSGSGFGYAATSGMALGAVAAGSMDTFKTFTGSLRLVSGEIGQLFIPAVVKVSGYLQGMADWIKGWSEATKTGVGSLAAFGIGLVGAVHAFKFLVNTFTAARELISGITTATLLNGSATALTQSAAALNVAAMRLGTAGATGMVGTAAGGVGAGAGVAAGAAGGGGAIAGAGRASVGAAVGRAAAKTAGRLALPVAVAMHAYDSWNLWSDKDTPWYEAAAGTVMPGMDKPVRWARNAMAGRAPWRDDPNGGGTNVAASLNFQSQQMGVHDLHDYIQRESMRDPLQKKEFEQQIEGMRKLTEAINNAAGNPGGANRPAAANLWEVLMG